MKKILLLVLVVCVAVMFFSGVGVLNANKGDDETSVESTGPAKAPKPEGDITIGFVAMTLSFTWMQAAWEEIQRAAEREGVEVLLLDSENNIVKQAANIEDAVARGVDAIITDPIDVKSLVPAIEDAVAAGVPVITFDRAAIGAPYLFYVGADDVEVGRLAARFIAAKLGGKGKVIHITGAPGSSPQLDRSEGFHEIMSRYPDIEIVYEQTGEFLPDKGMKVMEDAIVATEGDFDAVWEQGGMLTGVVNAMRSAGIEPGPKVLGGCGHFADSLRFMRDGVTDFDVSYPLEQAALSVEWTVKYLRTGELPALKDTEIPPLLITGDNLEMGVFYYMIADE
jgi:ABC-type sugar transport system substrate-binding protein